MQATGQYGEVPQYVGSRTGASHAHMFNLSHEMSLSSSATPGQSHAHGHSLSLSHPLANTQPSQSHIQQPPFLQSAQQQQQQQQLQQHQQQPQQHAQQGLHVNMGGAPPKTSSTGPPPPSHPPTASQQSTQTLQSSSQQTQDEIKQHQQQFHQLQQQTAHDPGNSRAQQQPGTDPVQLIKQKDQLPAEIRQGGTIMVDISSNVLQETVGQALLHKGGGTAKEELGGDGDDGDDEGERGASGNRWPRQEAIALLKIRSDMDAAFRDSSLKGPLWEEVSRKLAEMGYHRSAKKCKEKFENVHKYYKRTKEGKTGRQDGKNYRFFAQLEALYGKAGDTTTTSTITPGAPSSHLTTTPTLASKLHSSISVHQNTGPSPGSLISLNAENPLVSASSIPVNSSANHNTMHATSINHTVFSSTISNPTPLASLPPFNPTPAPAPASAAAAAAAAVAATNAHIARTLEKVESMAHDMHINDAYSDSSEEDDDDDDVDNDDDDEEDDEDNDDNDEDDDEDDEEDEFDEPVRVSTAQTATGRGKKRKRNSMKKYLIFFERVMKKILDKQEHMQQKFLEALERRDQERMIREEAWKRQEMARLNREHDVRAAERAASASRDASLVALLQKMTGQSIPLPQHHPAPAPPVPPAPVPHFASTSVQPLAMSNHHSTAIVPADYAQNESSIEKDYNIAFDPSSKRWPKPEVLALIKLRTSLDQRFHEPGSKAVLWEEISNSMAAQGYNRTPKRCKEKWENINKYFKKAKESNKKRPENAKTCPYFHHLNALYKEGLLGGGSSTDTSSGKQLLSAEKMEPGKSNHGIVSNHGEGSMQTQGDPDVFLKQHDNAVTNPVSGNANAMTIATTANLTLRPSSSSTPSAETKMHLFMVGERGDIKEHAGMVKNIGVTSSSDINAGSQPIGDLSTGTNSRASLAMASGNSRSFNLDVQAGASNRNLPSAPIIKQPDRSQT